MIGQNFLRVFGQSKNCSGAFSASQFRLKIFFGASTQGLRGEGGPPPPQPPPPPSVSKTLPPSFPFPDPQTYTRVGQHFFQSLCGRWMPSQVQLCVCPDALLCAGVPNAQNGTGKSKKPPLTPRVWESGTGPQQRPGGRCVYSWPWHDTQFERFGGVSVHKDRGRGIGSAHKGPCTTTQKSLLHAAPSLGV